MTKHTRKREIREQSAPGAATSLDVVIRGRARELIEAIVDEELEAALGAAPLVRVGDARHGYRHGTRERTLTTSLGATTFAMPRARVKASSLPRHRSGASRGCRGTNGGARSSMTRSSGCI